MASKSIAENDMAPPQVTLLPRCQYCGADPAPIIPAFIQMGSGRAVVFACGVPACRAIHGVQLTGIDQRPQPQGRIVIPQ